LRRFHRGTSLKLIGAKRRATRRALSLLFRRIALCVFFRPEQETFVLRKVVRLRDRVRDPEWRRSGAIGAGGSPRFLTLTPEGFRARLSQSPTELAWTDTCAQSEHQHPNPLPPA